MDWFEVIPSSMSAVASVAAAVAAIASWRVSRQAASVAESTALATHHSSASLIYVEEVKKLNQICHDFDNATNTVVNTWPKVFEPFDNKERGGVDPRPIRHVLYNGSRLLADHALGDARFRGAGSNTILLPIRNGMTGINESEYTKLLKKADETISSFEETFGRPFKSQSIADSLAFRWVYYQLAKRVDVKDWQYAWTDAWLEGSCLTHYQYEYQRIKPEFIASRDRLRNEKEKLMHTAFPITRSKSLSNNYDQILTALDFLIEDCDPELIEVYKDWGFSEDLCLLVVCSMGISFFAAKQLDVIQRASQY